MLLQETVLSSRYRIESVLGKGGMGAVYLASNIALNDKKVALKEMEVSGLTGRELDQAVRQFQKEAAFLAHLDHPSLVKVTDYFFEDNKHYLVMAYVEGQNLQQMLQERGHPFQWHEIKGWVYSLLDVLSYLHGQSPPILFRDLKPSNIMIEQDGNLRLIDFGIARVAASGDKTSTFLRGTGTRGFSPIEQYGPGQSTDARSDLYALAGTIYYLLSGKLPPDAVERVAQRIPLMPLSHSSAEEIPRGLDQVLEKGLALAKRDRYSSAELFKSALLEMEDQSTSCPRPKPVVEMWPVESSKPYRKKKLGAAVTGLVALLVLGSAATSATPMKSTVIVEPTPLVEMSLPTELNALVSVPYQDVRAISKRRDRSPRQEVRVAVSTSEPTPALESQSLENLKSRERDFAFSLGDDYYPKAERVEKDVEPVAAAIQEPMEQEPKLSTPVPERGKDSAVVTMGIPVTTTTSTEFDPPQYPLAGPPQASSDGQVLTTEAQRPLGTGPQGGVISLGTMSTSPASSQPVPSTPYANQQGLGVPGGGGFPMGSGPGAGPGFGGGPGGR